ncbi:MAG: DNA mismatch endonuclease Vsr [Candidatus Latescibacter sp.]|nr:DNA mismatch endonuclease Vsr [Candidatus Latescibacter sp.]
MTDRLTPKRRSWLMSRVPSKDTTPEFIVRRLVHAMGYRYRLHRSDLPGKPDIVLPRHKKIIFVHGCFWHRHKACRKASVPKSRTAFWLDKFEKNVKRDTRNIGILKKQGWKILVVWQCQTTDRDKLEQRLRRFLDERH